MEAALEAPSVLAAAAPELRVSLRKAQPAAEFLLSQLLSLIRAGAWDRIALWSTVRQAQVEFADLFGRSRQSVLLAGRARLPAPLRLGALNDDSVLTMLSEAFFAPFAEAMPDGAGGATEVVPWALPGLLALSFADLGLFRLPGGEVAWLCGKKPPASVFNGSGVFVVEGIGEASPTIRDQREAMERCLGMGSPEPAVRMVETGVASGRGRNLALLQGAARLTRAEGAGLLPWIIWENAGAKIGSAPF